MSKLELIETIVIGAIVLFLLIYYLIKAIKNGWVKKITAVMNESIRYAEKNITGKVEKKRYVMDKIEEECINLGIPYGLIQKLISKLIDKIIANYNVIDHDN